MGKRASVKTPVLPPLNGAFLSHVSCLTMYSVCTSVQRTCQKFSAEEGAAVTPPPPFYFQNKIIGQLFFFLPTHSNKPSYYSTVHAIPSTAVSFERVVCLWRFVCTFSSLHREGTALVR